RHPPDLPTVILRLAASQRVARAPRWLAAKQNFLPASLSMIDMAQNDLESMRKLKTAFDDIKQQLTRVIVGQDDLIEELLIALFSRGHCILEGVPGLAKTLMISTL